MLRYNTGVRLIGFIILLVLVPVLARAADDPCLARVRAVADACCQAIEAACATVKYRPRCDWPEHRCALTCKPTEPGGCVEPPCHQPVVPCSPCSWSAAVSLCHQPVVPLVPRDPCASEPVLTGGWHLLGADCADDCCR